MDLQSLRRVLVSALNTGQDSEHQQPRVEMNATDAESSVYQQTSAWVVDHRDVAARLNDRGSLERAAVLSVTAGHLGAMSPVVQDVQQRNTEFDRLFQQRAGLELAAEQRLAESIQADETAKLNRAADAAQRLDNLNKQHQAEHTQQRQQTEERKQQLHEVERRLQEEQREQQQRLEALRDLQTQHHELEERRFLEALQQVEEEIKQLLEQIEALERVIVEREELIAKLEQEVRELEDDVQELKTKTTDCEELSKECEQEAQRNEIDAAALQHEAEDARSQGEQEKAMFDAMANVVASIPFVGAAMAAALHMLGIDAKARCDAQANRLNEQAAKHRNRAQAKLREKADVDRKITEYHMEKEQKESQCKEVQETLKAARSTLQIEQAQLSVDKTDLHQLESKRNELASRSSKYLTIHNQLNLQTFVRREQHQHQDEQLRRNRNQVEPVNRAART